MANLPEVTLRHKVTKSSDSEAYTDMVLEGIEKAIMAINQAKRTAEKAEHSCKRNHNVN